MQDGVEHINPEILVFNRIELLCHTELTGCCKLLHCLKCNFIDNLSTSPLLGASDCNNCGEKSALPVAAKCRCYFIKCRRYCCTVSYDCGWCCRTEIVVIVVNDVSPDSVSRSAQVMNPGEQIITVLILSKPEQIYSGYQEINTVIKALQYEHHCFEGNCSKDQF